MVTVQIAWTITLVAWILYFVNQRNEFESWHPLVAGILLLVLMLAGVTVIVIHLGRQVAHNRAVKDFISAVSHDLRSPLATVKLHLETIHLRDLSPEQTHACLETALQELGRLESGIEDVLTASRIERSGLQVNKERVEVLSFMRDYVQRKVDEVTARGASLAWCIPDDGALTVRADQKLLRHLLDNLVDNAIVHADPGVAIRVDVDAQGGCAVLGVQDDGPGLDRKQWKRIFRMFYRAPGNRWHRKGTGLGLFIVSSIAQAHGGRVWVDSPGPDEGCHFRVALPLTKSEPEAP